MHDLDAVRDKDTGETLGILGSLEEWPCPEPILPIAVSSVASTTERPRFDLEKVVMKAPLGDKRRNLRAMELATQIIQGEASRTDAVPATGRTAPWAHAMGAFRFFNNPHLSLPALQQPCALALQQLCPARSRRFVVHDFSLVDYSKHNAKLDRTAIGDGRGCGYEAYTALVLDERGQPLGTSTCELRTSEGVWSTTSSTPLPFVDHYEQIERGIEAAERLLPDAELVHVGDRELDEIGLERFVSRKERRWLFRAFQMERKVRTRAGHVRTFKFACAKAKLEFRGQVEHDKKVFELWTGETEVTFHGPSWRGCNRTHKPPQQGEPITVRVVLSELRRHGKVAHRFVLLTNLDDPLDDIVQMYLWRWKVERLYFFLKVGLRLEDWEQERGDRIARRLLLSALAAMVIYQTRACAEDPEYADLLKVIATRGGWLGRKGDALGPIVLMRGMTAIIQSIVLVEQLGVDGLMQLARRIEDMLGIPLLPRGS